MEAKNKEIRVTRLKSVLAEKKMTGEELAQKIGVHKNSVSGWCSGFIPTHQIPNVSAILKVPMSELVFNEIGVLAAEE